MSVSKETKKKHTHTSNNSNNNQKELTNNSLHKIALANALVSSVYSAPHRSKQNNIHNISKAHIWARDLMGIYRYNADYQAATVKWRTCSN